MWQGYPVDRAGAASMKTILSVAAGAVLTMTLAACSSRDQEKAKAEIRKDAHQVAADAKKAGAEIKQGAKELSRNVDAAVRPDSQKASDKMAGARDKVSDAASKASVKLDQAALLAKVRTNLASAAGLSTLTNVDVSLDGSVVTLSGTVSTQDQKKAAEQAVSQVDGVTRVHNRLVVTP